MKNKTRNSIKIYIKRDICDFKKGNSNAKLVDIVRMVKFKHNLLLNKSTISKILKNTNKWGNCSISNSKRYRSPKLIDLENKLYDWIIRALHNNIILNDQLLIEQAKKIATVQQKENFKFRN